MERFLKQVFGYEIFRPHQKEIISHVLRGGSCLVIMPTGGGKSICYQLPALMTEGTAIVVSPLISLMKDQVEQLHASGIGAVTLNSMSAGTDMTGLQRDCEEGIVKFIYMSPERLAAEMPRLLHRIRINLIAIDEAHCISAWGHDFRPEYSRLGIIREEFPDVPVMALTATADKVTREDIMNQLHMPRGRMFVCSFDRPNLSLAVERGLTPAEKRLEILRFIGRHVDDPGIIYCMSKKNAESVADFLCSHGIGASVYHAGLSPEERNRTQEDFVNDRIQVVCATVAFGMGINKSNVRFVIHYNLPKSIESFYQEIGRAGRDGAPAETLLFYSVGDVVQLTKFAEESGQAEINLERLGRMREYAEADVCRRRILLNYFGQETPSDCGNCDVCRNPPRKFDGTRYVQMALSAVERSRGQITMRTCVDIVCGISSQEVGRHRWFEMKTFGVGREVPAQLWRDYMLQMLQMGFIEIAYDRHSYLSVTALGREVLMGRSNAMLAEKAEPMPVTKKSRLQKQKDILPGLWDPVLFGQPVEDMALYEKLRQLRLQISHEQGIPPYIIFSDKALHLMASLKPRTVEEFGMINGVGEYKRVKYGKAFVDVILSQNPL